MSGWPTRISRTALGPSALADRKAVTDPNKQFGSAQAMLLFWQAAGMNVVGDKAWVHFLNSGSNPLPLSAHGESWSPNGDGPPPTLNRVSAGLYTVTYPATVSDMDGNLTAPALNAAKAYVQGTTAAYAVASVAGDGRTVTVSAFNSAGTPTDAEILLEVK